MSELKIVIESLGKAFDEFKAANDERIKQIEAKGSPDPLTTEKVEKLNKQIADLQQQVRDVEKAAARPPLGGNDMAHAAKVREQAAKFFSARTRKRIRPTDAALDVEGYLKYCDAFDSLIRGNLHIDALAPDVRAAMQVGSDPDGGYFVPPTIATEIEKRIYDTSPMRNLARVVTIGTGAWEAPYQSSKGTSGGWVGERAARAATGTPTVGMQRIPVHEQYAYPEVTQEMLDDAMVDVEGMLTMETSEEMARQENLAFVTGNGVTKPRGFLDYGTASVTTADATRAWGVLQYIPIGAAGAFPNDGGTPPADVPDALISVVAALNPAYRQGAVWTMNRATEAATRKLKDRDGRYLVGFGDLRDTVTGFTLAGFPIENFEDMPDIAANSFSIAFGNFGRGYYIIDRMGYRVIRDNLTNKPYVGFYITKRTGGDVRNFDAIKLVKFAAA